MSITVAQAQTEVCENCNAQAGQPCTQPTDTGRKPVAWVHLIREDAYRRTQEAIPPPGEALAAHRDILSGLPDA